MSVGLDAEPSTIPCYPNIVDGCLSVNDQKPWSLGGGADVSSSEAIPALGASNPYSTSPEVTFDSLKNA